MVEVVVCDTGDCEGFDGEEAGYEWPLTFGGHEWHNNTIRFVYVLGSCFGREVDREGEAKVVMTGGDIRLPGPLGYEWALFAHVGDVYLLPASTVTTDNVSECA